MYGGEHIGANGVTIGESQQFRGPMGSLKWPKYEVGTYVSAQDLTTEQQARLQQRKRHNRYLHGQGIICGLQVVPAHDNARPWAVQVCPGHAIGCCGDEIDVAAPTSIDVRDYLWKRSHDSSGPAYVGIRYHERFARPIPVAQKGCGREDTVYESSRIQDRFQLNILWNLPEAVDSEQFDLCGQRLPPCPQCSQSLYVFLARIILPADESGPINREHINNGRHRR